MSSVIVELPSVTEPDGQSYTVKLDKSTPGWIQLVNNTKIVVNTTDKSYTNEEYVIVDIILTDETNAFKKYNVDIDVAKYYSPVLGNIQSTKAFFNSTLELKQVHSTIEVAVVNCNSDTPLSWITFNTGTSLLTITSPDINDFKIV